MDRIHFNLSQYENLSTGYALLAADNFSSSLHSIAAGKTGWTIFIQRITLGVTTDNAATQTFQDTASTPILAGTSKASPGLGPITWDFGEEGFPLTEGKGLDHKNSGAGLAASVVIQAYRKKTASQAT